MLIKRLKHLILILLISLILTGLPPVLATPPFINSLPTQNLIEQGKKFYEIGRFDKAIELLKQAVSKYQAIALSNLSLGYQKLAQWQKAEKTINHSLSLLQSLPKNKISKIYAQSLDVKGKLQFAQGEFENAITTWQDAYLIYSHFYHELNKPHITKSQALRHAQLALLNQEEYSIPYFWSSFILVGNWL
ncbi:tetratricopeptide repeat protein [Plectonema cf. radiosum LEGE 06105]|uniref:Tetratricopeptide repeat protein n=1 Tax=Plectonema cf. radiosum LEGE 06105 TaxID=945769 RepID=A0A8J7F4D7_9CYAN|nr:CHAT domain-containing protein [Plectonema radiosum]MBE9213933.1 tetratricopeptide repeat protein [Plectonema cf. radiosum LEGE 06105]